MTVFITGASAGIGAATAHAFASGGHRVVLAARSADTLADLARSLNERHGENTALALPLDVTDAEAHARAITDLPSDWRDIDVAVLNAGLAKGLSPVWENTVEEVNQMVDVNVKGVLNGIRALIPGMLDRARGHMVIIGSTASHFVYPGGTIYCATKHAVRALALGLKQDLHATPLRVSLVSPGLVETDFSLVRFSGDAQRADAVYSDTVALTPEDVAEAVVWATTQPSRVNVQEVLVTPRAQAAGGAIARGDEVLNV
ncbi:SDR family NAD(P)-dependent oxidoreductase [Rubricoccus marinus]|uniref:NAD(P)-dependent oxidoreductase n=1 Tax=Rubricoccus marinus TaxID=716817 RepID=A0A259U139_9BACT|nr:SDR family NAD(P)-dependent oxidoreductase [Rubricoccus marinus]OZC03743.1 NAD(P)-dependent oxidoreductase [Rubricoccus marinus]